MKLECVSVVWARLSGECAKHNGVNRKKMYQTMQQHKKKWLKYNKWVFLILRFVGTKLNWAWMVHAVHDNASETENKCFVRPMATSDRDRALNQLAYNVTMCCFFGVTYVFSFTAHFWCVSNCLPFSAYLCLAPN